MATIKPKHEQVDEMGSLIVADEDEESARIAGTGVECFAVYRTRRELGDEWEALRCAFHWLSEAQLRAALAYADAHSEAMARRWAADRAVDERLADLWRRHPSTKPRRH